MLHSFTTGGILTTRASFEDKLPGSTTSSSHSHVRHPSEDFILGSGGLAKLQSGMEKMGLSSDTPTSAAESATAKAESATATATIELATDVISQPPEGGDASPENSGTDCPETLPEPAKNVKIIEPEVEIVDVHPKTVEKKPPSLTSLLDPLNFTLETSGSPAKRKITKENFASSRGSLSNTSSDNADPLSQLDPLWSLKK